MVAWTEHVSWRSLIIVNVNFFALRLAASPVPASTRAEVPYCDVSGEGLRAVGCPAAEHDVNWQRFLEEVCKHCPVGQRCAPSPEIDLALQMGAAIAGGDVLHYKDTVEEPAFKCMYGVYAAVILVSQFFLAQIPEHLVESLGMLSTSLAPFPFVASQFSLYRNMVPVPNLLCNSAYDAALQNAFVPRVHPEDTGVCGMIYTDQLLIRRCRSRRTQILDPELELEKAAKLNATACPEHSGISLEPELAQRSANTGTVLRRLDAKAARACGERL